MSSRSIRSRTGLLRAALAALALMTCAAQAVEPEEQLADPALEARARAISQGLRCVVCQNQSIDDSDAQIAKDMRKLVRDRLSAGDSDQDVRNLLVAYYGEYVLLNPRFSLQNLLIWLAAPAALGVGGWLAWRRLQPSAPTETAASMATSAPPPPLSQEEQRRLDDLLKG